MATTLERITTKDVGEKLAHPEQSSRSCFGLFALKRRYHADRLGAACRRACAAGTISYRSVKSILATGLDTLPLEEVAPTAHLPATHARVLGAAYYDTAEVSVVLCPDRTC
jgi:hypothetical protein